jgi:hypothetical protein
MPAAAVVGAAVVGGIISSQAQSNAAGRAASASERAAQTQATTTWNMYNQSRADLELYRIHGGRALQQLSELNASEGLGQYEQAISDAGKYINRAEGVQAQGANALDKLGGFRFADTENAVNALGQFGFEDTKAAEANLARFNFADTRAAQQNLADFDFSGSQKYIDQLEGLNFDFQFDENDPVYQWRQQENQRRVEQALAARGGYDSTAAVNLLSRSGMELQAQEVERQRQAYSEQYGNRLNQLSTLYGQSTDLASRQYGQLSDVAQQTAAREGAQYGQLSDVAGRVAAREGAQYGQLADVAGRTAAREGAEYAQLGDVVSGTNQAFNRELDLYNLATNQATAGYNIAASNRNLELNRLNTLAGMGQNAAAQTGANAINAGAQLVDISQVNANNQQNAILQQGAAQANLAQTLGQLPANYLAAQYYLGG